MDDPGEFQPLGTSHVYGCEGPGCREIGKATRVWEPGYGYVTQYLCPAHIGRNEQQV